MIWTPSIVTTIDGRQVLSDSPEWRACCEAVWTLNKPEVDRSAWLSMVEKRRGSEGRNYLEREMESIEPAYLLALGSKETRRAYLAQVERHRGAVMREWLEKRLVALWEKRKAEKAS